MKRQRVYRLAGLMMLFGRKIRQDKNRDIE